VHGEESKQIQSAPSPIESKQKSGIPGIKPKVEAKVVEGKVAEATAKPKSSKSLAT